MWLMSAPPMKARPPAPENTTQRRSSSRDRARKASVRSSSAGGLSTFSRRELSNTTLATVPDGWRSQEMSTLCTVAAMRFAPWPFVVARISSIREWMRDSIDLARYSVFVPPDPFEDHTGPFYFRIEGDGARAGSVHCVLPTAERHGNY